MRPLTVSASVRADAHPDAGVQLTERVAVLARPAEWWTARGSVGTGYTKPTGRTEETEATGLRTVRLDRALDPEQSLGAMIDVNGAAAGVEALAVWRFAGGEFIANYGYARGNRPDVVTGAREGLPLLPRHRVGGDLMLERRGAYRMGIEGTWIGEQPLDDNPFRTASKPYLYMMAIAAR